MYSPDSEIDALLLEVVDVNEIDDVDPWTSRAELLDSVQSPVPRSRSNVTLVTCYFGEVRGKSVLVGGLPAINLSDGHAHHIDMFVCMVIIWACPFHGRLQMQMFL